MQNQLLEPVFKNSFPGNFRYFPGVKFLFIKVGSYTFLLKQASLLADFIGIFLNSLNRNWPTTFV